MTTRSKLGLQFDPKPALPAAPAGVIAQEPPHAKALRPASTALNLISGKTDWLPLGNNDTNDCVLAGIAHAMQAAAWYAMQRNIDIKEDEVLRAYSVLTGWNANDSNSPDPGMFVQTGLDYVHQNLLAGHGIGYWHRSNWLPGDEQ